MSRRFVGIDIGAETIKVAELQERDGRLEWSSRKLVEHHKEPSRALVDLLSSMDWATVQGAAVVGRTSRIARLPRIPTKQAQATGFRFLFDDRPVTVVSIGSHGFSVLELRESGAEIFRENSRCSQGTGNFLRQLVERFDLSVEQADAMSANVKDPAPLSGRCPVILKTDMTHLANGGEDRARILAGLYDAVCENVQVLIKPGVSPQRLALIGGVSRAARVQASFARLAEKNQMHWVELRDEAGLYLEALGTAVHAAEQHAEIPPLDRVLAPPERSHLDRLPSLATYLPKVVRMKEQPAAPTPGQARDVVLGFDIGSTGSKVVAVDRDSQEAVWETYTSTNGDPVGAAQTLAQHFADGVASHHRVVAIGATGSGREIVGSLAATCYGPEHVYVLNEIAAHAEGALHHDGRVDTIFEIGGQDAKYIRLASGRVVDAAMNEACSAGTGSFIEEQGRKFSGIRDVVHLGEEALCAESGVSLGQHCSVFMAEIIDEAVASGVDGRSVVAGIYDSIVQNYLNRVKGSRSVGDVVFCQGMPFSSDALAAAVARQTGSQVIVPPNPGTVGALGIALLTIKALPEQAGAEREPLDLGRFLGAEVTRRDTFVCKSDKGCGEPGNLCRIERIATVVDSQQQRFTWGGNCSIWDKGTGKQKLPDRAPDPFREREQLAEELVERHLGDHEGSKRVVLSNEFHIKPLLPFFTAFLDELGFDVVCHRSEGGKTLKQGIERANVPFCAPMQLYHGLVTSMAAGDADYIFAPMLREMPRVGEEEHAVACPIVQASPDLLRWDLGTAGSRILSPVIDFGTGGFDSTEMLESCRRLAASLGVGAQKWWRAYQSARLDQEAFEAGCSAIGERALAFCREHDLLAVVVLGRPYTIHNSVLNSHVPPLLREQGAMAIPIDCYPVADDVPVFEGLYWGYGQRNLRAAHQIRRTDGVYSMWCSNYSCGPDSFNLHFYAYAMDGKPYAIIETDGHSGDAGTKTRVEAFLHCVREHESRESLPPPPKDLQNLVRQPNSLPEIRARGERLLVPRMGHGAAAMAACLRGAGLDAEALPMPTRKTLEIGRRQTSGKECVPMTITMGSLLEHLEAEKDDAQRFAFFMPTANGPCRFGAYNVLHRAVLERLGWSDRVRIWSPNDDGYFDGLAPGLSALVMTGFVAQDMLYEGLLDTRPVERRTGAAEAIFERHTRWLLETLEEAGRGELPIGASLLSVANGRLFGCADVLKSAAREFAAIKAVRVLPTVLMVGEIYVRNDPFANDFLIDKLEARGIRVRFAPFSEWLEYCDHVNHENGSAAGIGAHLSTVVQKRIQSRAYSIMAEVLAWPRRTTVKASLDAARPYIRDELEGEAILTVGGPLHEWREGLIDGVVSVGPLECMPTKVAQSQLFHVAEQEGLVSLTVPYNGDPVDPELLDGFAFEIRTSFDKRASRPRRPTTKPSLRLRVLNR